MPSFGRGPSDQKEIVVFIRKASMVRLMRPLSVNCIGCVAAIVGLAGGFVRANVDTNPVNADANPYATIVDRNPFGLKPPPPPPAPPEQTTPPVPMAKVTLTGLLSTFGEPRALLEIVEDPAKGGGQPKRPPPMREGERHGTVEILSIDVVKNMVRLRNSGVETNVTFEVAKATPTPGGPGIPGAPPMFTPPPALQQPQAAAPTVISPNGANASGVTLVGGGSPAPGVTPNAAVPGALGATDSGMRTIPSRPLRTENTPGQPMTKEQTDLLMEMNRLRGQPGNPEQDASHQNQNPAFPRLPYTPRTPPPVPR
jgi:hypothetical protein